jgi:hypothetical protein
LQDEAARFDLAFSRSTGNPTLLLQFLLPENQPHFTFTRERIDKVRGTAASKIAFAEREHPTVVTVNDQDVLASGAIWLQESDGAVLRTHLVLSVIPLATKSRRPVDATVTVDFQRDARLALWLPARMDERYPDVTCTSVFTNFRRFETSGRVVGPAEMPARDQMR